MAVPSHRGSPPPRTTPATTNCPARHGTGRYHHDRTGERHDDHRRRVRRPPGVFLRRWRERLQCRRQRSLRRRPASTSTRRSASRSPLTTTGADSLSDTDGRIQLVHEYFVSETPSLSCRGNRRWAAPSTCSPTTIAASDPGAIGAWDWATDELGGFEWSRLRSVPQRNVRAVHPDPYSGAGDPHRVHRLVHGVLRGSRRRRRCRFARNQTVRMIRPGHGGSRRARGRRVQRARRRAVPRPVPCGSLRNPDRMRPGSR